MRVIKISQIPEIRDASNPMFTDDVSLQPLSAETERGHFTANMVNFSKGARNKLHAHSVDQLLIVTTGTGIVAAAGSQSVVTVGDVIHVPAGEHHWHGATRDSEFSHISIMAARGETRRLED